MAKRGHNLSMSDPAFSYTLLQSRGVRGWHDQINIPELQLALQDQILSFDLRESLRFAGPDGGVAGWIAHGFAQITGKMCILNWECTGSEFVSGIPLHELTHCPIEKYPWDSREAVTMLAIATYRALVECSVVPITGTHVSPTIAGMVGLCVKLNVNIGM